MAKLNTIELATEIVTSFVSNNSLPRSELAAVIEVVHGAIKRLTEGAEAAPAVVEAAAPAVPIVKSVTPDYLICLEDGKRFKSLRRHLSTLGMTPEQYRAKWRLPSTYPMVASNYAAQRSALAKAIGLGQMRETSSAAPQSSEGRFETAEPAPNESAPNESAPEGMMKRRPGRPPKAKA